MIDISKIKEIAAQKMADTDLFFVDITCSATNEIELLIDSDTCVSIDQCIVLSKEIEAAFDREVEDYELTVASAGIGQPLRIPRQYKKTIGKEVEVVLKNGVKIAGVLTAAEPDSITVTYPEKVAVEGKKRKVAVETTKVFPLEDVKSTKMIINFK